MPAPCKRRNENASTRLHILRKSSVRAREAQLSVRPPYLRRFYAWWYDKGNLHINFITELFTAGNLRQWVLRGVAQGLWFRGCRS